ncbi:hypothetical protein DQ04_04291000 [Trypanosoma grayi]|uniref:hypothetical protein n=1 Tax=Trypanosoma grayi TaxID=71804 RepID=UPI0004F4A503|nr:hypothetical protein DQ04_04291000 [Trypanosoma grayi]KEG10020.1 hypothetical protein DQ04_04291000 [Trypanosoma grayi]
MVAVRRGAGVLGRLRLRRGAAWSALTLVVLAVVCYMVMLPVLLNNMSIPATTTAEIRLNNERQQQPQREALSYVTQLLTLLKRFELMHNESTKAIAEAGAAAKSTIETPESMLSAYYEEDLVRLNNALEKSLDSGYAEHVVHSDAYWSPYHAVRRGYGLEGSIFVGLLHHEASYTTRRTTPPREGKCAMTLKNIYDNARWPIGVFTGVVEVVLDSAARAKTTATGGDQSGNSTWSPLPPSVCVPESYLSMDCEERYVFCPADNIRVRQLRFPLPSEGVDSTAAATPRRRTTRTPFSSVAAQRYATLTLYRGETYVLFLRDGLLLVPQWDAVTRLLLLQLPSRHSVLSQAPNTVSDEAVRAAWTGAVISSVNGLVLASTQLYRNISGAAQPPTLRPMDKIEKWMMTFDWALDTNAVRLHTSGGAERTGSVSGTRGGDLGITEAEVVDHVFGSSSLTEAPYTSRSRLDGSHASSGGIDIRSNANKDRTPNTRRRRDIQLYWLYRFREALQRLLILEAAKQNTTSYIAGFRPEKLDESLPSQQQQQQQKQQAMPLFFHITNVNRLSHVIQDKRYMQPSPTHWCTEYGEQGCPDVMSKDRKSNTKLPFQLLSWITTDFLFARAEAFFDYTRGDESHTSIHSEGSTAKRGSDHVPLDPFIQFVTPDEEAVLLSARLWTHGWDLFSPTEPIVFFSASNTEATSRATEKTHSPTTTRLRWRSVARLCHILFGARRDGNGEDAFAETEYAEALREVGRYGLGERRSREQMLRFLDLDGGATQPQQRFAAWCKDHGMR